MVIDLTKKVMQESITVKNSEYLIHTDFRKWICFEKLIKTENASLEEFDFLYVSKKPIDKMEGFKALLDFYKAEEILPRAIESKESDVELFDFTIDASLIYSAFLEKYKIDLLKEDMHWHRFVTLFRNLENTKFAKVMEYRLYEADSKNPMNKEMLELKSMWEIRREKPKRASKYSAMFEE